MRPGFEPERYVRGFGGFWFEGLLLLLVVGDPRRADDRTLPVDPPSAPGRRPAPQGGRRYAAGEIERVEFERIQRDLEAARASALNEPAESDGSEPPS